MTRMQVLLQDEQERRLEELAQKTGLSKSSLVREAVELLLEQRAGELPDPLLALVGQAGSAGRDDISERHDTVLTEAMLRGH